MIECMAASFDRTWDNAVQLGHENAKTLELARRHCLNMQFEESGGRGAAEAATGLPINMRQVRCPVAIGDGMAMNLAWIARDFYRQHCVGCTLRRPTGDVPNLATIIDAEDEHAARAAQEGADQLARAREEWPSRREARRALSANVSEAMVGALTDLGVLDPEPGGDAVDQQGALRRLVTLADRAPQVFTPEFVAVALELVTIGVAEDSLEVCRHLVQTRSEFVEQVVKVALQALRRGPLVPAGRALADLTAYVTVSDLDEQIVRSLILLAGAPALDRMGRARTSQTNDRTGLRAAADVAPDLVVRVLEAQLPGPRSRSSLIVPGATAEPAAISTFMRAAAGRASASLAHTHPDVASRLVPSLIRDLAVEPDDHYDDPARPAVERALAVMLTLGAPCVNLQ